MDALSQLNAALSGRYDLERELGSGGMATVYLARDLKHNRHVAVKVLRPDLGAVLGIERFLSEIRVTANLQHPNLLPLFDSGEAGGQLFYVMPYVQGESLRSRLNRDKQLPVDEAIHIATSVASALDYAHRQGVIHRDLKPENILLSEGQPLVADFGIALAVTNAGGGRITQTGLSLGTPHYMSPEQATGDRTITAGTDIYSLAAVTYEMLTGEPPHTGSTSQAIIARVLTETPRPIRVTRPSVPEYVESAITRALEKLPADRFSHARDFADAIAGKVIVVSGPLPAVSRARAWWRQPAAQISLGAIAVAWVATLVVIARRQQTSSGREIRFSIPTPFTGLETNIAISPDGRYVAYVVGKAGGGQTLSIRPLSSTQAQPIAGTEGVLFPFWSPDSRTIAWGSGNKLKRVDVAGGAPQNVADLPGGFAGGTWNERGVIVFGAGNALYRVPAAGGVPTKLNAADTTHGQLGLRFPWFLPDGRHFLFLAWGKERKHTIYLASVDGGTPTQVLAAASKPVYAAGYVLTHREGTLLAQPFDGMRLSGEPIRLADSVAFNAGNGAAAFSASSDGTLVFRTGATAHQFAELRWYTRDGKRGETAADTGSYGQMNLAPDDRRIAIDGYASSSSAPSIWIIDVATRITSLLTSDSAGATRPIWFPDARTVGFDVKRRGFLFFHKKAVGASADSAVLESTTAEKWLEDVSFDGRYALYHQLTARAATAQTSALFALPLTGGGKPIALGDSASRKDEARFSPDGRWVSFSSNETGGWELYVASFPAFNDRRRVSPAGGRQARWRADGAELFYLSPEGRVMAIPVRRNGAAAEFGTPVPLFQSPLANPSPFSDQFSVTRDGRRFLFLIPMQHEATTVDPITVVLNWPQSIKR